MKKIIVISSLIFSGGLLVAGQAIGQFQSQDQTLQQEQSTRSGAGIDSADESLGRSQTDFNARREDKADDQQSGFVSGSDQRRFQDDTQQEFRDDQRQFDRQQQQRPLQQEFGVSPRFENRDDIRFRQPQTQGRSDDQPGGSSDMSREPDSSAIPGLGQGRGESGGSMQSGPGGGGFGGQGGSGSGSGSGGSGGSGGQ